MNVNKGFKCDYDSRYQWEPLPQCLPERYPKVFYNLANVFALLFTFSMLNQFQPLMIATYNKLFISQNQYSITLMIFLLLSIVVSTFVIHELIHILFMPTSLFSEQIYIYIKTKLMQLGPNFAVVYNGEQSKARLLVYKVAPFMLITIIPLAIMIISGKWNIFIILMVIVNTTGCIHDLITTFELFLKLPRGSVVHVNKYRLKA